MSWNEIEILKIDKSKIINKQRSQELAIFFKFNSINIIAVPKYYHTTCKY